MTFYNSTHCPYCSRTLHEKPYKRARWDHEYNCLLTNEECLYEGWACRCDKVPTSPIGLIYTLEYPNYQYGTGGSYQYECSECGTRCSEQFTYCPECGVKIEKWMEVY